MHSRIDAIGFDLDNTLYEPNPGVDELIREYVCRKAGERLKRDYESLRKEFDKIYAEIQSGRKTLEILGVSGARELVQDALENSNLASLLKKDERLNAMLKKLSFSRDLFLITGSSERLALEKLEAMGLNPLVFRHSLYAESPHERRDGSAFRHVAKILNTALDRMMFVGDREKTDVIPAKRLGIKTAMVNNRSALADVNLEDIYELENLTLLK